ncbi:MAG: hypothetical protein ACX933_10420 [Marinobacter adhaerens]
MIREDLKYPSMEAAISIFQKMGIEASTRFDKYDQDFEYTSCRVEEIAKYLEIYQKESTTEQEKRILGCFLFECLNEYIQNNEKVHEIFAEAMALLHRDEYIHNTEIEYWTNTEDPDKENWWPITQHVLQWRNT